MFGISSIKKIYTSCIHVSLDAGGNIFNSMGHDADTEEREVDVVDVTCREGDQSPGTSMNRYEKATVALGLKQAGIPIIEIGFPANPVDYDNTKFIMEQMGDGKSENDPIISVLGRANKRDTEKSLEILEGYDKPRIHLFIATSEKHLYEKFRKGDRDNFDLGQLEDYVIESMQESLDAALDFKIENPNLEIEISLEDASQTGPGFFKRFINHFDRPEVTCINIPDTMGVLTNDGTQSMFQYASDIVENVELSTHNHNDRGLADSNTLTGIKTGVKYAETTLGGAGEGPGNAVTSTIVNNIDAGDLHDNKGNKITINSKVIPQEVGYVSSLFMSIVDFDRTGQLPYIGDLAYEDAAGVHAAAKSVYRAGIDSNQYGHVNVEEFFSARGGETQMIEMMGKHGITINKNTSDTPSPEANYWMRRCIKTSEREKFVYSRDMFAMYLEAQGNLSVGPIELQGKKIDFGFTYKGNLYSIKGEGGEDQGFIHGFMNGISNFIGEENTFKLIGVDPKNKTPLRQSATEYLDISERTLELSSAYNEQLMSIVKMDEKNHYTQPLRDLVDELILDGKDVSDLDTIIDSIIESEIEDGIESRFKESLTQIVGEEIGDDHTILVAFRNAISEIKKYGKQEHDKSKGGSQLGICTTEAEINGEKVHSTVSNTNLDEATLISIFRTALPEIIQTIESKE